MSRPHLNETLVPFVTLPARGWVGVAPSSADRKPTTLRAARPIEAVAIGRREHLVAS
jgi:hypothetical protein